jgi:hypothetical protein
MNIILSIILILSPAMPGDVPATAIWIGKGVDPIKAEKISPGETVETVRLGVTPYDFVRLKTAMEGATDLCTWAIDESVAECHKGLKQSESIAIHREERTQDILSAYEVRLDRTEKALMTSERYTEIMIYVSSGLAVLAASTTALLVWRK